eukprot:g2685.t1
MLRWHDWRTERLLKLSGAQSVKFIWPQLEIGSLEPEFVRCILKDKFSSIAKPQVERDLMWQFLTEWIGARGIFLMNHGNQYPEQHNAWFHQRKLAAQIFSRRKMNTLMHETFVGKAKVFCSVLEKSIDTKSGFGSGAVLSSTHSKTGKGINGTSGVVVDMQRMFFAYTMDSIMTVFFGCNTDSLNGVSDAFSESFDEAHRTMFRYVIGNIGFLSFAALLPFPFGQFSIGTPWESKWKFTYHGLLIKLHRIFNKDACSFKRAAQTCRRSAQAIIDARRRLMNEHPFDVPQDLLALFLASEEDAGTKGSYRSPKSSKLRKKKLVSPLLSSHSSSDSCSSRSRSISNPNSEISEKSNLYVRLPSASPLANKGDKSLCDNILNFVIAGRDTTACSLSWLFYILSTHQEIQKKLIKEIDSTLPNLTVPELATVASKNMPYLNGIIYETLRLYPPVPEDHKVCSEPVKLPCGSVLPTNTRVMFCPYAMGRDPRKWPNPSTVDPTRWIPFKQPDPFSFPVFQAGPRICLGRDMALFEIKILTCMLLQRFTFDLLIGEKENIGYSFMITMSITSSKDKSKHELLVIPKRRKQI